MAVSQLGPHKAPGPDDMLASFFQKHWTWVGAEVIKFVKEVFQKEVVPEEANHSLICFIPKQAIPESISQFRPICLSNVVIKIITKVIANRMKPLMNDLVGLNQASFIPGRHTTDNILVAQEVVHSVHRKKGWKGAFVAKINLKNTYDQVEMFCEA